MVNDKDILRSDDHADIRYRVVKTLHGGMGVVHFCDSPIGAVVLKMIGKTDRYRQEAVSQFEKEALLWARIRQHPNIARLEMLDHIDGNLVLVSEFVGGGDLRRRITNSGPLSDSEIAKYATQLARAMQFAHDQHGLVHCDLKPGNCLLTEDGNLKITDFGVALLCDDLHSQIAGTPAYMAPEQLSGGSLDTRTDIYSFGLILFEMISGIRPTFGPQMEQVVTAHAIGGSSPFPGIVALAQECVRIRPSQRPKDFSEVLARLGRIGSSEAEAEYGGRGDPPVEAEAYLALGRMREALDIIRPAYEADPSNLYLAGSMAHILANLGDHEAALRVIGGIERTHPDDRITMKLKAIELRQLRRVDEAIAVHRRLVDLFPDDPAVWLNFGVALVDQRRYREAIAAYRQGLRRHDRHYALWANLGLALWREKELAEGLRALSRALEINPRDSIAWVGHGRILFDAGQYADSLRSFERALAIRGEDAEAWLGKADSLAKLGRSAEADECYDHYTGLVDL